MLDQLPTELLVGIVARVGEHPEHVLRCCKYVWQLQHDARALLQWLQHTFGSAGALFMLSSVRVVSRWPEEQVVAALQQLLAAGCYIQDSTQAGCILYWACKHGYARVLDALASHLADRSRLSPWLNSLLKTACAQGDEGCVRVLLSKGADPNVDGGRPLRAATEAGCSGCVAALLESGADVHAGGECALRLCAVQGTSAHVRIMDLLLQRGADVHAKTDEALSLAVERSNAEAVELLLRHGANASARQVLESAAATGSARIVRLLLAAGAPPNADGGRPLRAAAEAGAVDVVRCLLYAGAQCGTPANNSLRRRSLGHRAGISTSSSGTAAHPAIACRRGDALLSRTSQDALCPRHQGMQASTAAGTQADVRPVSSSWTPTSWMEQAGCASHEPSALAGVAGEVQHEEGTADAARHSPLATQHSHTTSAASCSTMQSAADSSPQHISQVAAVPGLGLQQPIASAVTAVSHSGAESEDAGRVSSLHAVVECRAEQMQPLSHRVSLDGIQETSSDGEGFDEEFELEVHHVEQQAGTCSSDGGVTVVGWNAQQAAAAGSAALCAALCADKAEVVRVLLKQGGARVDAEVLRCWRQWHRYPAIIALLQSHTLLRRKACMCAAGPSQQPATCLPAVQQQLQEALIAASREGAEEAVQLFLTWGAPVTSLLHSHTPDSAWMALHQHGHILHADSMADLDAVLHLHPVLQQSASPHRSSLDASLTCKHATVQQQQPELQQQQVVQGLFTPACLSAALTAAASAGQQIIVRQLLHHMPQQPAWIATLLHPSALHAAVSEGHLEVVRVLLQAGIAAVTLSPAAARQQPAVLHKGHSSKATPTAGRPLGSRYDQAAALPLSLVHTTAMRAVPISSQQVAVEATAATVHTYSSSNSDVVTAFTPPPPPLQSEAWGTVVLCAAAACKVNSHSALAATQMLLEAGFSVCATDALRLVASGRVPPWRDDAVTAVLAALTSPSRAHA